MSWKDLCQASGEGYYTLQEGVEAPVRLFLSEKLFAEAEESLYPQIQAACRYPGVMEVVITPDTHHGYVVPVGCVIATDGTLLQAACGYDIGCGMMSFRSTVPMAKGFDDRLRRKFSEEVMNRVGIGVGKKGKHTFTRSKFQEIIRRGAAALGYERGNSERDFIPIDDAWDPPAHPVDRGLGQLGSLGGGNHFIELQHDQDGYLWVMVHTGSRGFGHGLATHFIQSGKAMLQKQGVNVRGGAEAVYFEPDSPLYFGYKNAVAAGGNFAIANRLLIWEGVGTAFRRVFSQEPELVYEISHNLVQEEVLADGRKAWIHRKGATRAFPAGHPMLDGTKWEKTGHPVLIPGSMGDQSFILTPKAGAEKALFSVNHGCGRRMSRSAAKHSFTQSGVNKQMKELNVMVNGGGDVPIDE
ncbi:MAG: RtcB family protein, partial [Chloroflexi bacterium]|nr:RtcB family protein [Chloroflexota bacterium]